MKYSGVYRKKEVDQPVFKMQRILKPFPSNFVRAQVVDNGDPLVVKYK